MDTPVLIVNFKTYQDASNDTAIDLAYTCEKQAHQRDASIAIAPQNADIYRIAERVDTPIIAQHTDPHDYGSNTGKDIVQTLQFNGAEATLINHSEDKEALDEIEKIVEQCKKHDMTTIVCVDEPSLAENVAAFKPDFIAYEPEELIGGDVSVSSAKPEILEDVIDRVGSIPVLAGAGVKTAEDVETALDLGAEGVLVASGIVKADDPDTAIRDLVDPF